MVFLPDVVYNEHSDTCDTDEGYGDTEYVMRMRMRRTRITIEGGGQGLL